MSRRQWAVFNVKLFGPLILFAAIGAYSAYAYFRLCQIAPDSVLALVGSPIMIVLAWWSLRGIDAWVDAVADQAIKQIRETERMNDR